MYLDRFLCESVYELRHQLKKRGSDLIIRFGSVEKVALSVVQALQADDSIQVDHIYMTKEYASEEIQTEEKLMKGLKRLSTPVPLVLFHSRSLGKNVYVTSIITNHPGHRRILSFFFSQCIVSLRGPYID